MYVYYDRIVMVGLLCLLGAKFYNTKGWASITGESMHAAVSHLLLRYFARLPVCFIDN